MLNFLEINFITDAYNKFLLIFPIEIHWLISLLILISLILAFITLIRRHWLFIFLLVILIPALIPLFRSLFLSFWNFGLLLLAKVRFFKQ